MLVTIVGLVLVLAAAFYVVWPLFAATEREVVASPSDAGATTPEHDKEQALLAIREADFDHRTGKLSDEDYAVLREELEARALSAIAAVDAANALHAVPAGTPATTGATGTQAASTAAARGGAEPAGFCPACGVRFGRDARFCPGCGKSLPNTTARGRRRA